MQCDELGFDLALLQLAGLVMSLVELGDLLSQRDRIDGGDDVFQLGDDFLLLLVGQVLEVFRQTLGSICSLPVRLRVSQDLLPLVAHALQAATDRVEAGGETSLEHRHRECRAPGRGRNRRLRP